MKKIAFHTLGCKLNFSETSGLAAGLDKNAFSVVPMEALADVYVLNTCSVTAQADKECRSIIRKIKTKAPDSLVVVTGCYAQLKPEEISSIEGVDVVLGTAEKFSLSNYINRNTSGFKAGVFVDEIRHCNSFLPSFSSSDRTRTFLKVQDGCDYFCSFCTIPLARGKSRSDSIAETIRTAKKAADSGAVEIILTGINLGDFGSGTAENFLGLIAALEKEVAVPRFRISSIEPNLLSEDIIRFVGDSEKFCPHFHVPLQSGSDKILTSMRRRYNTQLYQNRIETILKYIPNAGIGVDVITGFPGETEKEFQETVDFISGLSVSYLHVFTYSEREKTLALKLPGKVPVALRRERTQILRVLSEQKRNAFYKANEGKVLKVLFESGEQDGTISGYAENYIKVKVDFQPGLSKKIVPIKLSYHPGKMEAGGELLSSNLMLA